MYTLKWLFALTTLFALAVTGYLYSRECERNNTLRNRQSVGKSILNERFIRSLIADEELVGSLVSDRDDLSSTCDRMVTERVTLDEMSRKSPATQKTTTLFPNLKIGPNDVGYLYSIPERIPPGFMEGEVLSGYVVISREGVIIGIFPIYNGYVS